jgi:hypothetical protein
MNQKPEKPFKELVNRSLFPQSYGHNPRKLTLRPCQNKKSAKVLGRLVTKT